MFWILQAFGPRILNILKWHICVVEQAILFWISTKTICKKSPVTIQPNHLPSSSKARSKGTALPSPSLGAAKVPWLFVPEKPKEEVPANARVVFHSMILLGMMTFFGKGRLLVVKKNGSLKQLCKLCAFFFLNAVWQQGNLWDRYWDSSSSSASSSARPCKSKIVQAHTQLQVFEDIAKSLKLQQSTIGSFCMEPCNQSLCCISLFFCDPHPVVELGNHLDKAWQRKQHELRCGCFPYPIVINCAVTQVACYTSWSFSVSNDRFGCCQYQWILIHSSFAQGALP